MPQLTFNISTRNRVHQPTCCHGRLLHAGSGIGIYIRPSFHSQKLTGTMGAWGHRNFENDGALDFLDRFQEEPTLEVIKEALEQMIELKAEEEYIEVDIASEALAAAEWVAALLGKPSPDFPEELKGLLAPLGQPTKSLVKLAARAVKATAKESELQELWAEGGEPNEWQDTQADLLKRLA